MPLDPGADPVFWWSLVLSDFPFLFSSYAV